MEGPLLRLLISSRSINKHGHHSQFLFLIGRFLKTSPLKSLGQMNRNLVGSIYGRSSITIAHFILIHLQTWPSQAILVSDWSISKNLLLWNCFAKMNRNLVGNSYGRFCIKFPQSRMKGERHRFSPLSL
jgi:hypothetical protein